MLLFFLPFGHGGTPSGESMIKIRENSWLSGPTKGADCVSLLISWWPVMKGQLNLQNMQARWPTLIGVLPSI
jgi:hypothetical protein